MNLKYTLERALASFLGTKEPQYIRKEDDEDYWWFSDKRFYEKCDWDIFEKSKVVLLLTEHGIEVVQGLHLLNSSELLTILNADTHLKRMLGTENTGLLPSVSIARPMELWWQTERREQKAQRERMIALRNAVRKICGQG